MQYEPIAFRQYILLHKHSVCAQICFMDQKCLTEMKQAIADYESGLKENIDKLTKYSTQ